jgi:hypothetical protein
MSVCVLGQWLSARVMEKGLSLRVPKMRGPGSASRPIIVPRPRSPPIGETPGVHAALEKINLKLVFQPDVSVTVQFLDEVLWEAELQVHAQDISYLMRHGFHWDESNVLPEQGYLLQGQAMPVAKARLGWEYCRVYILQNTERDIRGQWRAQMRVHGRSVSAVSQFRLGFLSVDNIRHAEAWGPCNHCVYFFNLDKSESFINVYYDDLFNGRMVASMSCQSLGLEGKEGFCNQLQCGHYDLEFCS